MYRDIVWILGIAITSSLTRIYNLLAIPIFTDEAIYIRWAQIGLADPAHRFISLTDGKQPLFTWLMYPWLRIFSDPLYAGRFVSVLSGVFGAVGMYVLGKELFGRRTGIVAALLYILSPFFLLYDRLALMDSLQASLGIWSIYLSVLLVRTIRLDVALILGIVMGLGYLTKSAALFYILLLPVSLLVQQWKGVTLSAFFRWGVLACLSSGLAYTMYNMLRLSPWFYLIKQKDQSFVMSFAEFMETPFKDFDGHIYGMWDMMVGYLSVPVALLMAIGIIWGIWKKDRRIVYLFLCFLFPFLSLAAFAKIIFPRYLLFMVVPLYLIGAYCVASMWIWVHKRYGNVAWLLVLVFSFSGYQSFLLLTDPVKAQIPSTDRNQLFDDWPSGYGVKDVVVFLENQAKTQKIVVGTEGTFGLFPAALEIYLQTHPNIEIHGYWPVGNVPDELMEKAKKHPTYLVFKDTQHVPESWPLRQIAKIPRGVGKTHLLFYQVVGR